MVIVEKLFGWLLLGIVGAMVVVGGAGAALAGLSGLMASPGVVLVVLVVFAAGVLLLGLPVALGAMWAWRWWRMTAISERQASEFVAPDQAGRLPVPASLLR